MLARVYTRIAPSFYGRLLGFFEGFHALHIRHGKRILCEALEGPPGRRDHHRDRHTHQAAGRQVVQREDKQL